MSTIKIDTRVIEVTGAQRHALTSLAAGPLDVAQLTHAEVGWGTVRALADLGFVRVNYKHSGQTWVGAEITNLGRAALAAAQSDETQATEGKKEMMIDDGHRHLADEVIELQRGLAERDAEVARLRGVIEQVVVSCDNQRDRQLIATMCARALAALAAAAPAGEQQKTSEANVARPKSSGLDHNNLASPEIATRRNSPPAEAPQESGVPSGKAGCRACDPLNPGDVGEPHTCRTGLSYRRAHAERATRYTGTLRGEYEQMAREWLNEHVPMTSGASDRTASLAALLARVADERQSAIVEALKSEGAIGYFAKWIASNAWRAALAAARKETP